MEFALDPSGFDRHDPTPPRTRFMGEGVFLPACDFAGMATHAAVQHHQQHLFFLIHVFTLTRHNWQRNCVLPTKGAHR
jgi:hypothetical protein